MQTDISLNCKFLKFLKCMECAAETLTLRWPTHYTQDSCTKPYRAEYSNKASTSKVGK